MITSLIMPVPTPVDWDALAVFCCVLQFCQDDSDQTLTEGQNGQGTDDRLARWDHALVALTQASMPPQ
jgi:hypothetical protein